MSNEGGIDWIHEFEIHQPGYGSFLDGCNVEFHLCDKCLEELFNSFKVKPKIDDGYNY